MGPPRDAPTRHPPPDLLLHDTGPEAAEPYVSEVLTERADRLPTQVADQIQGFIAQRLTGILVTEDGVYDANLQILS